MDTFAVYCRWTRIFFLLLFLAVIHNSLGQARDAAGGNRTRRSTLSSVNMLYIGSVPPRESVLRMETSRPHYYYADDHPDCIVTNIGKKLFYAKLLYGSVAEWFYGAPIDWYPVEPGQTKRLSASGNYAATVLEITNTFDVRAVFYAYRGTAPRGLNQPPEESDFVEFDAAMTKVFQIFVNVQLVGNAYSHNFAAGVGAEMLYEVLFPEAEEDPWEQIKSKVEEMINTATLVIINAILENDIKPQKAKVRNIVSLIGNPLVHDIYMAHVHELVGYETKFYFSSRGLNNQEVNLHILPLYVRTVNMKIGLYTFGLTYQKDLNLTVHEVDLIKKYRMNIAQDAIRHIERVKMEKLDHDYTHMDPDFFYDRLMKTRTEAAVHGEEYFAYWKQVIDPENNPKINNTVMSYSDYFGVSTPSLYKQALLNVGKEPLSPRIVHISSDEVRRIALQALEIHYHGNWRKIDVICGMLLKFENGVEHKLGSFGYKNHNFELKDNKIEILEVRGNTATVDCLNFTLTDKSSKQFGHNCNPLRTTFKLKGHYISSLFISKDNGRQDGRVVNIAVSYQLLNVFNATELTSDPKDD